MATRAKARDAARAQSIRSGRVPQSLIDAQLKAFDNKDLRLRSVGPDVRKREAKRRITDIDIKAGQPGTNLCRFTGVASSEKQRGKRPYFYGRGAGAASGGHTQSDYAIDRKCNIGDKGLESPPQQDYTGPP